MYHASSIVPRALFLTALLSTACGGRTHTPGDERYAASVQPGTRAPTSKLESLILERLAELPAGETTTIEGHTVIAGPTYDAASGRQCRQVEIQGGGPSLACLMPEGWAFVPRVFEEEARGT